MLWIVFSSKPMLRNWSRRRCAVVIDVYTPVMIPSEIVFVLCWAWIFIKCTVLRATLYGPRFVVILFRHRSAIGAVISTDIYVLIHSAHWVPSTKYVQIYQLSWRPSLTKLQVVRRCVEWSARDCIQDKDRRYGFQSILLLVSFTE